MKEPSLVGEKRNSHRKGEDTNMYYNALSAQEVLKNLFDKQSELQDTEFYIQQVALNMKRIEK